MLRGTILVHRHGLVEWAAITAFHVFQTFRLAWLFLARAATRLAGAFMAVVYSAGIARWDERRDLRSRFGTNWEEYRSAVHDWWPRLRPYHAGQAAKLYLAAGCGPCSELRSWLESRDLVGLELIDAETLPHGTVRRMRYDPKNGCAPVDGVRAMGRALEHLHVGWALAGAALRLPLVWRGVQVVMDASGLGPRIIRSAD